MTVLYVGPRFCMLGHGSVCWTKILFVVQGLVLLDNASFCWIRVLYVRSGPTVMLSEGPVCWVLGRVGSYLNV